MADDEDCSKEGAQLMDLYQGHHDDDESQEDDGDQSMEFNDNTNGKIEKLPFDCT